jgi:hypothetical protein
MNDRRYGKMMLPVCSDPHARPVLAVIVCVSFVLVCGFVLYHTVIAGMACGFSNSIATFSYNVGMLSKVLVVFLFCIVLIDLCLFF